MMLASDSCCIHYIFFFCPETTSSEPFDFVSNPVQGLRCRVDDTFLNAP